MQGVENSVFSAFGEFSASHFLYGDRLFFHNFCLKNRLFFGKKSCFFKVYPL
jgi:hypothetical protein